MTWTSIGPDYTLRWALDASRRRLGLLPSLGPDPGGERGEVVACEAWVDPVPTGRMGRVIGHDPFKTVDETVSKPRGLRPLVWAWILLGAL